MLAVAQVFNMASITSGRTIAQAEMIEAAHAFESAVRDSIRKLAPSSLLIIESPTPVANLPDVAGGRVSGGGPLPAIPVRHDRLVFLATSTGPAGAFESVTDRSIASATGLARLTFTAPDALLYIGPGRPIYRDDADGRTLDAIESRQWIVARRAVLFDAAPSAGAPRFTSFTGEVPPAQYPLGGLPVVPPRDIYACGIDAVQETAGAFLARVISDNPPLLPNSPGLWQENLCPAEVNDARPLAPTDNPIYYRRAGFALQPRIADIRIEWTDGAVVDPTANPDTQWFGQRRDAAGAPGWTAPGAGASSGDPCSKRMWLSVFDAAGTLADSGAGAFGNPTLGPAPGAIELESPTAYRAVWTAATWAFRPTALRFTFRAFDAQGRISSEENIDTTLPPDGTPDVTARRYGLVYSFVVPLPP
ncbi:MAG: hypothetical protein U1A27_01590 [Phycisphaerae bacterium]